MIECLTSPVTSATLPFSLFPDIVCFCDNEYQMQKYRLTSPLSFINLSYVAPLRGLADHGPEYTVRISQIGYSIATPIV